MRHRQTVLLAGGVLGPTDVAESERWEAACKLDEALVSLVRAAGVFGVRLALEFDPAVSALVAQVAGQYIRPIEVEGDSPVLPVGRPVAIYAADEPSEMLRADDEMERRGYATILNLPSDRLRLWRKSRQRRANDLMSMRRRLVEDERPVAMVVIGGDSAAVDMVNEFVRQVPKPTIYAFESTGGTAARLARGTIPLPKPAHILAFDTDFEKKHKRPEGHMARVPIDGEDGRSEPLAMPYAYLVQQVLEKITRDAPTPSAGHAPVPAQ